MQSNHMTAIGAAAARWCCGTVLALLVGSVSLAAEKSDDYLRGYLDALLDSRFAGLGLTIKTVSRDGIATIAARTCLGPAQRRDIERLLIETERVTRVAWDRSTDCDTEPAEAKDEPLDVRFLSENELFAPLMADPRQPRASLSYQRYQTPTDTFNAGAIALGHYFAIGSGFMGRSGASQLGLQGAVFALFNLDAPSKDLINADYWIGLPWSYRKGPWSYLVRVYHQSSHLGDEFILGNPGLDRVNLSYEDAEGLVSYEWRNWRFYGGGGYILNSEPDLARKHAQAGVEYMRPRTLGHFDFIAAVDIQASEELDWAYSRSYVAGLEFHSVTTRRVGLLLEHFRGHSPNGQFFRESLRYTGLGLYFGF